MNTSITKKRLDTCNISTRDRESIILGFGKLDWEVNMGRMGAEKVE